MKKYLKWFSLIELIVSIAIVSILMTIAFVSYSWNVKDARNTNREALISQISSWLEAYKTNSWVYIKADWIKINFGWEKLWDQWYFKDSFAREIWLETSQDILSSSFPIYRTSTFLDKMQLWYFVENEEQWSDLKFSWDKIWIFMIWDSIPSSDLDLSLDMSWIKVFFDEETSIEWWNNYEFVWSCLDLKKYWLSKNWIYSFKTPLSWVISYYCNMEYAWWWWTLVSAHYDFDSVSSWSEWVQWDYDPTLQTRKSFALNDSQIPSHTEFWFSNSLSKIEDYVTFSYSPWSEIILENTVSPMTSKSYDISRRTWNYYQYLDPESWISLSWDFNNSMIIDENLWYDNQKSENSFIFSPNSANIADRSAWFWWESLIWERQNFPFLLWVR